MTFKEYYGEEAVEKLRQRFEDLLESEVSSKSKNPEITFIWGTNKGQLSVTAAKGYAMQILESCEAAVQDASLYRAVMEMEKGRDEKKAEHMAWALIQMVRDNRGTFEGNGG